MKYKATGHESFELITEIQLLSPCMDVCLGLCPKSSLPNMKQDTVKNVWYFQLPLGQSRSQNTFYRQVENKCAHFPFEL